MLRLCLYDATITVMHSSNWSTYWNIYSSPCCLPTWTKWLTGLFDWQGTWLDPAFSPSIHFVYLEQSSISHFYMLQGNYLFTSLSHPVNAELLKGQERLPIHLLPSAHCSASGSVECGQSVNGMVIDKLPLWYNRNVSRFLIPKCVIVWSHLEGPIKEVSWVLPQRSHAFSHLHMATPASPSEGFSTLLSPSDLVPLPFSHVSQSRKHSLTIWQTVPPSDFLYHLP